MILPILKRDDFGQKYRNGNEVQKNSYDGAIFNPVAEVKMFGKKSLTTDDTDAHG